MDEELKLRSPSPIVAPEGAAKLVAERAGTARAGGRMPAFSALQCMDGRLFDGHARFL